MKRILILCLVLFASFECNSRRIPNRIRDRFTNCYSEQKTRIRSLLEIDGYYEVMELGRWCYGYKPEVCYDTNKTNILFYDDGSFIYNFYGKEGEDAASTLAYLKRATTDSDSTSFYTGFYWGIYRIENDTIIIQYIDQRNAALAPWVAFEERYRIVDRQTIQHIPSKTRDLEARTKRQETAYAEECSKRKFLPAKFIASPYVPEPHSWLKRESWVYCKNRKAKR